MRHAVLDYFGHLLAFPFFGYVHWKQQFYSHMRFFVLFFGWDLVLGAT